MQITVKSSSITLNSISQMAVKRISTQIITTKKWFVSSKSLPQNTEVALCNQIVRIYKHQLFRTPDYTFAIEIGEDFNTPISPSSILAAKGAELIFSPAASCETAGKYDILKEQCKQQSARSISGRVYSSCGYGESSGDTVFAGNAFIAENGKILNKSTRFSTESQLVVSEIDVEKLRFRRMGNTTFADTSAEYNNFDVHETFINKKANTLACLTREISPSSRALILRRSRRPPSASRVQTSLTL